MKAHTKNLFLILFALAACFCLPGCECKTADSDKLALNDSLYFEKPGFNILVFNNMYDNLFDDSKVSALEIIHHGIRTATNGDVRLNPSPGQWDPIPKFVDRKIDTLNNRIEVTLNYPAYDFTYTLAAEAKEDGLLFSVNVDKPLPEALKGVAGLNLELFPPVFWGTSYLMDSRTGLFPTSVSGEMTVINNQIEPKPFATGKKIEIAPDTPLKHLTVSLTEGDELLLFDGRNKQQNGTFTLRTLLPSDKTGKIAEWFITGESVKGWLREPVVSYSQVGYHPSQNKLAVVELDKNDKPLSSITLWKVNGDGSRTKALSGKPDVLQQIEHGALQLAAQVKSIGYAIAGINESHLYQYRHLGDAVTKTDNVVGSGPDADDRWAFTNRSPSLNYSSASSLAAAARVLKGYNDDFAEECLALAQYIWKDEHTRKAEIVADQPFFTRGSGKQAEFRAAFELWRTTGDAVYKAKIDELLPEIEQNPRFNLTQLIDMAPYMGDDFLAKLRPMVQNYAGMLAAADSINPFGVMISPAGWAANGQIIGSAVGNYKMYKLFPDLINPEYVSRALNYIYGCHPAHNLSFVSGVGAQPKKIAYGNNRADFSFIPGGIVPGIRIIKPDFPENRDDYPFHWSENEYVIPLAPNYIYLVNAVNDILKM